MANFISPPVVEQPNYELIDKAIYDYLVRKEEDAELSGRTAILEFRKMLEMGIDPNAKPKNGLLWKYTNLLCANRPGALEFIRALVDCPRTDVNLRGPGSDTPALTLCRCWAHSPLAMEALRMLLEREDLDVQCRDTGDNSLLHVAIDDIVDADAEKDPEMLRILLEDERVRRELLESRNASRLTPLATAVLSNNVLAVEMLLAAGANPRVEYEGVAGVDARLWVEGLAPVTRPDDLECPDAMLVEQPDDPVTNMRVGPIVCWKYDVVRPGGIVEKRQVVERHPRIIQMISDRITELQ